MSWFWAVGTLSKDPTSLDDENELADQRQDINSLEFDCCLISKLRAGVRCLGFEVSQFSQLRVEVELNQQDYINVLEQKFKFCLVLVQSLMISKKKLEKKL